MITTTTSTPYLAKVIRKAIERHVQEELEQIDAIDALGDMSTSFSGIDAPALYSGGDDSCDKVLEALIIYFVKQDNLKQLPEAVQANSINVLSHLHSFIQKLTKYDRLNFEAANLYRIKRWREISDEEFKYFINWYGLE